MNKTYDVATAASLTDAGPEENDVINIASNGMNNSQVGTCSSSEDPLTFKNIEVSAAAITKEEKIDLHPPILQW